jgi:hypothetical protein
MASGVVPTRLKFKVRGAADGEGALAGACLMGALELEIGNPPLARNEACD